MPIPVNAPIEGDPNPGGDRHVLVLDNSNCFLYELYNSFRTQRQLECRLGRGMGSAGQRTTALDVDFRRCRGSADFSRPGALRRSRGRTDPARPAIYAAAEPRRVRSARDPLGGEFHESRTRRRWACACVSRRATIFPGSPPTSGHSDRDEEIWTDHGRQRYVMYISGAPDGRWDNNDLHNLGSVTASDFEVVQMNPIYTASNVPQGAAPSIASFTGTASSGSGSSVTLSWSVSNASYVIISPQVGAVRGNSVTVSPASNHHVHSLCHQPVRAQHGDSHGKRAVANVARASRSCRSSTRPRRDSRLRLSGGAKLRDSDSSQDGRAALDRTAEAAVPT